MVFDLIRSVLELTIYRTRDEHANHYATDAVDCFSDINFCLEWSEKQILITNMI